jgi:hypothetical protein
MNGNNSWQRMGQFARFPRRDLGPVSQPPAGELFPVGQMMGGGGIPAPAMMPQQPMPQQQVPQQYGQGQPTGKKILGMPKDRFIALMGTIAQAFGGDSPSGRMGAGLINMADIMHQERMGQAAETKARREAAGGKRKKLAEKREKPPKIQYFRTEDKKGGFVDMPHTYDSATGQFVPMPGKIGKRIIEKKPTIPKGQAGFNEVNGILHKGFWHLNTDTGKYIFAPTRKATKPEIAKQTVVKPAAGEKPKEMTYPEKRARAKIAKESEAIIVNPEYQSAEYQNELQMEIDNFDRYSDKPYTYQLIPGKVVKWGRDVPPKVEKVDISTPEKVRDSDLPVEIKLRLLKTRFGYE